MSANPASSQSSEDSVALIAMAGRFPGAANIEEFRTLVFSGNSAIRSFSDEELIAAGVSETEVSREDYRPHMGWLPDIDLFDADFFGLPPRHAKLMDPQQRLFLECAWETCERAGYAPRAMPGRVGVFAGSRVNAYLVRNIGRRDDLIEDVGWPQILLLNDPDHLPLRVAHALDLSGPAVAVGATCSTSLTAIHLACQSLLSYESDMALAGGSAIMTPDKEGYRRLPGSINSADGRCRAFDADASGTVSGNGIAVVLLKRLDDALADGDQILSVIRGTAIGNDGANKAAYAAPSVSGQVDVLKSALATANVDPADVSYVETHGTGTVVGDPIEFQALRQAYGDSGRPCRLGALKPLTGHLSAAAGAAAVIKATLCLQEKRYPPLPDFRRPNSELNSDGSRLVLKAEGAPWPSDGAALRRAGVSAFGLGGANAHAILEEAPTAADSPEITKTKKNSGPWVIPLSARSDEALARAREALARWLEAERPEHLADISYTLQVGRTPWPTRFVVMARNWPEVVAKLRSTRQENEELPAPAENWRQGHDVDWRPLHQGPRRRILLPTTPFERKSHWVCTPAGEKAPFLPTPAALAETADDYLSPHLSTAAIADMDALIARIDAIAAGYILGALNDMGTGSRISLERLISHHGVKPSYAHLTRRLMGYLCQGGLAEASPDDTDVWYLTSIATSSRQPRTELDSLVGERPELADETAVFARSGPRLAELLTGRISPVSVVFPDGDLTQATTNYRDSGRARILNGLVASTVAAALDKLPMGRPFEVLEVGGGTGATSHYLLPLMPAGRCTYTFTDVSSHFLTNARRTFAEYDFLKFGLYDVCRPPVEQGFPSGSYDLIVAANVLHVAPDLRELLRHLEGLLVPGGLLVMLEGTANTRFSDIGFGTLEGWDNFADADIRHHGAFADSETWCRLMTQAGFASAISIPDTERQQGLFSSVAVIVAQAPTTKAVSAPPATVAGVRSAPKPAAEDGDGAFSDPEQRMLAIWQRVLGHSRLDLDSRFFEMGGDSLIATQMLARIRDEFGSELPVRYFFGNPSIRQSALDAAGHPMKPATKDDASADDGNALLSALESLPPNELEALLNTLEA